MYFELPSNSNDDTFELEISDNDDVKAIDDVKTDKLNGNVTPETGQWEGVKIDAPVLRFSRTIKPVD